MDHNLQEKSNIEKNLEWFYAAETGNFETIKTLIDNNYNINALNPEGESALHQIKKNSYKDPQKTYVLVKYLIENGININAQDKYGNTAFTENMIIKKFPEIIHLLIDCGANIYHKNAWGHNLLKKAMVHRRTSIVDRCIASGMSINHRMKNNKTFAENAYNYKENFKYNILKELLRYEEQLNQTQRGILEKEKLRLLFKKTS